MDINAAKQRKKKGKKGKGGTERKEREEKEKETGRKVTRKEERNDSDLVRHCAKLVGNATLL